MRNVRLLEGRASPPWHALVREEERKAVFDELEARLEARAVAEGELSLTIPYACFDSSVAVLSPR